MNHKSYGDDFEDNYETLVQNNPNEEIVITDNILKLEKVNSQGQSLLDYPGEMGKDPIFGEDMVKKQNEAGNGTGTYGAGAGAYGAGTGAYGTGVGTYGAGAGNYGSGNGYGQDAGSNAGQGSIYDYGLSNTPVIGDDAQNNTGTAFTMEEPKQEQEEKPEKPLNYYEAYNVADETDKYNSNNNDNGGDSGSGSYGSYSGGGYGGYSGGNYSGYNSGSYSNYSEGNFGSYSSGSYGGYDYSSEGNSNNYGGNQGVAGNYQQMNGNTQGTANSDTASLVFGILSIILNAFCCFLPLGFLGIPAIVMANNSRKNNPNNTYSGKAIAGMITGIIGLVLAAFSLLILIAVMVSE